MRIFFCWDDGAKEDLKLIELHEKYNIPGMFFVPTYNREGRDVLSSEEITKTSTNELISFGGHTSNHTYLTTIPIEDVAKEILDNKDYLEKYSNRKINHFCLPGGKYNKKIIKIVLNNFSTCRTADTCSFRKNIKNVIVPSFHFYNRGKKSLLLNCLKHFSIYEFFIVLLNLKKDYFEIIKKIIIKDSKFKNKDIIIWGHSWELENCNLWPNLECLMNFVSTHYANSLYSYDEIIK